MRGIVVGMGVLAIVGAGAVALLPDAATGEGLLHWQNPEVVAAGAQIYDAQCAACHGADLEGEPNWRARNADGRLPAPPHDPSGHTWHHPDAILIDITTRGTEAIIGGGYQSDMMGFGEVLSDAEIIAVLSYIKSTWPPEVIAAHDDLNANHAAAMGQ